MRFTRQIDKFLFTIHRILGTLLSILFAMWFASGLVMIYHTFPYIPASAYLMKNDCLHAGNVPSLEQIRSLEPQEIDGLQSVTLHSYLGSVRLTYNYRDTSVLRVVRSAPALKDTTATLLDMWSDRKPVRVDTLYRLDEWIINKWGYSDFPVYKFHFNDQGKHQLYIGGNAVLQYVSQSQRLWGYLSAVPHWIYIRQLTQYPDIWIPFIMWSAFLGCFMCLTGIYLGVKRFRVSRFRVTSMYRRFSYKWHHIMGAVFGVFCITSAFSGAMSVTSVPQWLVKTHTYTDRSPLTALSLKAFSLEPAVWLQSVCEPAGKPVYRLKLQSYLGRPVMELATDSVVTSGTRYLSYQNRTTRFIYTDASQNYPQSLHIDKTDIGRALQTLYPANASDIRISTLTAYDSYYINRNLNQPLPVWKAEINDEDRSLYYFNPSVPDYYYYNSSRKVQKYLYSHLHNFTFPFLVQHGALRIVLLWVICLAGLFISLTGCYLGIRYLMRTVKKLHRLLKKHIL